ncbi:unnamed protein product [Caenorhabditis auriculariae]|uniref:Uncharacterized protein n=1 Tax=Caenorhabditis auriculariae TaxID=2777116 RepID=A0A8S1HQF6_9PELO|nr:unnamed protein product [Caenorhabditis auriculariae]
MLRVTSLLGSLLLVAGVVIGSSTADDDDVIQPRQIRNFPYSVSLYRMLGHDRQLRPYYGSDDEVAALIDSMNKDVWTTRLRRSEGVKGYACRFKFCRIFDA